MKQRAKGFTILEILVALSIISLVFTMGVRQFRTFFSRLEAVNGVRAVTVALSTARYNAIKMNCSVKLFVTEHQLELKKKVNKKWEKFLSMDVSKGVLMSINAAPVFFSSGYAAPSCSIYINNENHHYKVSLSFAGRIKTVEF